MADKRNSFVLYTDHLSILDMLTDEQAGQLFKTIAKYQKGEDVSGIDYMQKLVFEPFRVDFERDAQKWEDKKRKRAEAGRNHRGNQYTRQAEQMEQNGTNVPKMEQMEQIGTNGTVNVNGNGNVNGNVNLSNVDSNNSNSGELLSVPQEKPKPKKFIKPTLQQVADYCKKRGNNVNPEKFIAHYESNGWKVGKNKMQDWQASVRYWEQEEPKSKSTQQKELVFAEVKAQTDISNYEL